MDNDEYKFKKDEFKQVLDNVFNKKSDLSIDEIIDTFNKININVRKRVKVACINCKKNHKKCSINRPCQSCINNKLIDTCKDPEKKRK
jgi:hypothetical protein